MLNQRVARRIEIAPIAAAACRRQDVAGNGDPEGM